MKKIISFKWTMAIIAMFSLSSVYAQWNTNGNTLTGSLPATPNEWLGSSNGGDLIFKTSNTESMRINASGTIIVNGPGIDLYDAGVVIRNVSVNHGITDFCGGTGNLSTNIVFGQGYFSTNYGGSLSYGLSSNATVPGMGFYGVVGVTNPTTAALLLSGSKKSGSATATIGNAELLFQVENSGSGGIGSGTKYFTILGNGYVGIGATAPAYQLELSTNSAAKPTSSAWTVSSDRRLKTNIAPYTKGLDVIRNIELVSYQYNGLGGMPINETGVGVIAQDFQKILPDAVKSFTYSNKENGKNEAYLGVDFHELFVLYVNAIKQLDNQNMELVKEVNALKFLVNNLAGATSFQNSSSIKLFQNNPNPFTETTSISYEINTDVKTAVLYIYDMQGKQVRKMNAETKGKGSINISGRELNAGIYMYSLIADGQVVDTKRMILTE